ncbi:hypothetical protein Mycsm_06975 (plasmid) [Mycobacterium sp. JS623]|uniref:hypothetical protein n=1 Tax=Mycobacterium sp. JS623 TaxID=212767 RepID=UPI0002A55596|nr:hypothetical protein [Mycobacterium sp. JS623]AGB27076.1 hypothetical protein Mycsm_06975 [Mycobacterium sp. JS623]
MPDTHAPVRWMSVALTTQAVRDRIKTQTRRDGWLRLQPGNQLALCPKYRGVRRADRELITIVDVVDVRREPLETISPADVAAEGFAEWTPAAFVEFFCNTHRGVQPSSEITRIEWTYPRICRGCGCTEYAACAGLTGPCSWAHTYDDNTGQCSECALWAVDRASENLANGLWRLADQSTPVKAARR